MESFLQAKLTDLERAAYLEFLASLNPDIVEEGVENVILHFRAERSRLPLPAEFRDFCPEVSRRRKEQLAATVAQWQREYEMENRDGSVARAKERFRRKLKEVAGKKL
jgi:hypothetical protein